MKLQTNVPLKKQKNPISYESKVLLLGSCFAEHMAAKLRYHRFPVVSNPFGILFHPIAIKTLIERSLKRTRYAENELFYQNETWQSFDAHSDLKNGSNEQALESLNAGLDLVHEQLLKSSHIIITLGTAWVYRFVAKNRIVANCHKVSQKEFAKELLPADTISESLKNIINQIRSVNDNAAVILTVSPVRHLKDGFIENTQSKSHLLSAVHDVLDENRVYYFPSYELMMDELRDYRFYGKDMVHPNEIAIDYIWEKFMSVWIDPNSYPVMEAVDQIQKGLSHRPFQGESIQHQAFKKDLLLKIKNLQKDHPHMEFEDQ